MSIHDINNLKLHYEIAGKGETSLLFVHGLGGDGRVWKYQVEHFSERYQVVTVDLFGHGESSKEVDPVHVPRRDAEAIDSLMRNEIRKQYFVIGHSFAGLVLAEMIKMGDPNMKGVVLADCTYQGYAEIIRARTVFGRSMLAIADHYLRAETEKWYRELMGPSVSREDSELILSSLQYCNLRWLFQSVAACPEYDAFYPQRETPVREALSVFIMEADNGIGADMRKSWINHFKRARYHLFEQAYHFFPVVNRKKFNALLEEFVEGK